MYKHKFKAKPTTLDGIHFASKAEATYYTHLLYEKEKGNIVFFLRQAPFHLPGNTRYVVDFIAYAVATRGRGAHLRLISP